MDKGIKTPDKKEEKSWLRKWLSSLVYAFSHYTLSDDCCYDIHCY